MPDVGSMNSCSRSPGEAPEPKGCNSWFGVFLLNSINPIEPVAIFRWASSARDFAVSEYRGARAEIRVVEWVEVDHAPEQRRLAALAAAYVHENLRDDCLPSMKYRAQLPDRVVYKPTFEEALAEILRFTEPK